MKVAHFFMLISILFATICQAQLLDSSHLQKIQVIDVKEIGTPPQDKALATESMQRGGVRCGESAQRVYFCFTYHGQPIDYFIDGQKQAAERFSIPLAAILNVNYYCTGLPAKFGDTTGRVVAIETKGYFDLLHHYNLKAGKSHF